MECNHYYESDWDTKEDILQEGHEILLPVKCTVCHKRFYEHFEITGEYTEMEGE